MPHPYVTGMSDGTDEQPDNIPNAENESSWDNILLTILVAVIILLVVILFFSILMV
jgi:heme/copper-type cytochrome/quinol oxidase subunit 2